MAQHALVLTRMAARGLVRQVLLRLRQEVPNC